MWNYSKKKERGGLSLKKRHKKGNLIPLLKVKTHQLQQHLEC